MKRGFGGKKHTQMNTTDKAVTNQAQINKAIKQGATLVKNEFWNGIEYGLQYRENGYFRITKRTYDKLTKAIENA